MKTLTKNIWHVFQECPFLMRVMIVLVLASLILAGFSAYQDLGAVGILSVMSLVAFSFLFVLFVGSVTTHTENKEK